MGLISVRWAVVICQGPPTKMLTLWVYQNPTGRLRAKIIKPCHLSKKKKISHHRKQNEYQEEKRASECVRIK